MTRGLLACLDKEELEGVVAHEIAHIRNLDEQLMTYAAALAGSVAIIAELLFKFDFLDLDGPAWFVVVRPGVYLLAIVLARSRRSSCGWPHHAQLRAGAAGRWHEGHPPLASAWRGSMGWRTASYTRSPT